MAVDTDTEAPSTVVWVTGASSGIGAALVRTLPFPAEVIGVSRRPGDGRHLKADLATAAGWDALAQSFGAELAGDAKRAVLIHAAGTLEPMGFAAEVDQDGYRHNVLLNSASPQIVGAAFLQALQGSGIDTADLVILSSGAARSIYPGWSSYGAGKAAVDAWVRNTGAEQALRGQPCRVLSVAPGVVATAMQESIRAIGDSDFPSVDKFVGLHERGELLDPDDVAKRMWALLDRDDLENGAVIDLRTLGA